MLGSLLGHTCIRWDKLNLEFIIIQFCKWADSYYSVFKFRVTVVSARKAMLELRIAEVQPSN